MKEEMMGDEAAISGRIVTALAEHLKCDQHSIKQTDRLRDDLGLDSMATIELLYKIEEAFDLQIPDQDLTDLRTVGDVARYVQHKVTPVAQKLSAQATATRRGRKRKNTSSRS